MLVTLLITAVFIGLGWFVLIRPQQQRAREQAAMVAALEPGDQVISAGGIHGTVTAVADETVALEIAPEVTITLARAAVARPVGDAPETETETAPDEADAPDPTDQP